MKLLATGDWQCGQTGALTLEDQEVVWHRLVDVAIERDADLFLHAGDLVHGPIFTMEQLAAIRRVFARLRAAKIPVVVVTGNSVHDLAVRPVHALDVFKDYDGIHVSDRPEVIHLDGLDVATLPWVSPARLLAMSNGEVNHEKAANAMTPMLVKIATDLIERGQNDHRVLLAHWFIDNTSLPTGIPVDQMREPVLPWADLDAIGYDAVIAGHNHHGQQISQPLLDATLGIVVGSPQPLDHGEEGYAHGAWLVEVGDGSASAEFVPIESKRFVTIEATADLVSNGFLVYPGDAQGDIVRVRYQATEEEARRIDHDVIRKEILEAGASCVTIKPQIIRANRARSETISEQMSHEEALLAYCKAQELSAAVTAGMLERMKTWGES